jgi:hypothetical protein
MRYSDIKLVESKVQNVQLNEGARIDHAEDIVFWEGSRGAMRAVEALKNLEGDSHMLHLNGTVLLLLSSDVARTESSYSQTKVALERRAELEEHLAQTH